MNRRLFAVLAVGLIGVFAIVAALMQIFVAVAVALVVLSSSALVLSAYMYSKVAAEGATQRSNLANFKMWSESRMDTLESAVASRSLLIDRSKKIMAAMDRSDIKNEQRIASVAQSYESVLENLSEIQAVYATGIRELLDAQAIASRRAAAWNDGMRSVVESIEDVVEATQLDVAAIDKSVGEANVGLAGLQQSMTLGRASLERHFLDLSERASGDSLSSHERLDALGEALRDLEATSNISHDDVTASIRECVQTLDALGSGSRLRDESLVRLIRHVGEQLEQSLSNAVEGSRNQLLSEVRGGAEKLADLSFDEASRDKNLVDRIERMQRELESASSAAVDSVSRLAYVDDKLAQLGAEIGDGLSEVRSQQVKETTKLNIAMYAETQQTEALMQLLPKISPRWMLPSTGRWAMDAKAMLHLWQILEDERPTRILELGSGTSTVWLGYMAEQIGASVVSIEHDADFKTRTEEFVSNHRLDHVVSVRHAPLEQVSVDDDMYKWYALSSFDDVDAVDLLVIDGPVGSSNRWARYPALPVLHERLSAGSVVLLDDSNRPDEADCVDAWTGRYALKRMHQGFSRLAALRVGGD